MPRTKVVLSPREADVLKQIGKGKTYSQIGTALGVTHETVKTYVARLRTKLGVRKKAELARKAKSLQN